MGSNLGGRTQSTRMHNINVGITEFPGLAGILYCSPATGPLWESCCLAGSVQPRPVLQLKRAAKLGARKAQLRGGGSGPGWTTAGRLADPARGCERAAPVRPAPGSAPRRGSGRQLRTNQRAASPRPQRPGPRPPRPARQWQRRLRAEPDPGRGGAEPRGILEESAGRWGFWEENSISSFPAGFSRPAPAPQISRYRPAGAKRPRVQEHAGHVRAGQVLPEVLPGAGRDGALHGPQSTKGG